jgi:hypothetical protein
MPHFSPTRVPLPRLVAFFVLACQGCGTHARGALDSPGGQDATPDMALAQDAGGGIVLPPACGNVIAGQATAQVTATVACFSGQVSSGGCGSTTRVCARFDFGYNSDRMFQFRTCDSESQSRIDKLGETATAALQGFETGSCSLSAPIINPNFESLKDTIIGCGGGGYAIVFDSVGAVAEVRSDTVAGNESQILSCILAASGGVTLSCLANVQICSTSPPT